MIVENVLNHVFEEIEASYSARDVMLYALGLGLGTGADELRYVFEDGLVPLPFLAMVLANPPMWLSDPALDVDYVRMLHAEQNLTLLRPLPAAGQVRARFRVLGIADKGADKGALVYTEKTLSDAETGAEIARVTSGAFCRADGGTGNHGTVPDAPQPVPDRAPDLHVTRTVEPRAAMIYRLSGDYNPLHISPDVAAAAGYDRPILHGLCTMGMAGTALLEQVAGGDPARFGGYSCRFSRPVFPGESLRTEIWRTDTGARFRVICEDRDQVVLDRGTFSAASLLPA